MDTFYVSAVTSDIWENKGHPPINTELQNHYVRSRHAPKIDIVRTNYSKEMGKLKLSRTVELNVQRSSYYGKWHGMLTRNEKRTIIWSCNLIAGCKFKSFWNWVCERNVLFHVYCSFTYNILKVLRVNMQAKHKVNMWYTASGMLLILTKDR